MTSKELPTTPPSSQTNQPQSQHEFNFKKIPIHVKKDTLYYQNPIDIHDPIDISSDTSLSLPETLSLPSTPSTISQTPTTTFPLNFPANLDDRYRELLTHNILYN